MKERLHIKLFSCPICGNESGGTMLYDEIVNNVHYYYSICNSCGFVYQQLRYQKEHYELLPCQSPKNYNEHAQNRAKYIYDFCRKYFGEKIDLLDIGCGRGAVMHYISQLEPKIQSITGYTLKTDEEPFDKRLRIIYKNFEDLKIKDEAKIFNFVIMSHTLEHFYDPTKAMANVFRITKPGSLVYIEVPNLYWTEVRIPSVFTPEHLSYFTPTSLENVYDTGFILIKRKVSRYWGNIKVLLLRRQIPTKRKIKTESAWWVEKKYNWVKMLYPYYQKRKEKVKPNG